MRISDWSSDVCSSDLGSALRQSPGLLGRRKGRSARKFILAGAGKGLIQDRSENILPGKLLPVWFCSPESIACRNFDDRLRSEEHTSELQSLMRISYAVFCLKKKKINT